MLTVASIIRQKSGLQQLLYYPRQHFHCKLNPKQPKQSVSTIAVDLL
jgi:hypothetical protein